MQEANDIHPTKPFQPYKSKEDCFPKKKLYFGPEVINIQSTPGGIRIDGKNFCPHLLNMKEEKKTEFVDIQKHLLMYSDLLLELRGIESRCRGILTMMEENDLEDKFLIEETKYLNTFINNQAKRMTERMDLLNESIKTIITNKKKY